MDSDARFGPIALAVGPLHSGCTLRPMSPADEPFVLALFQADRAPQFTGVPEPMRTTLLDHQFRAQQIGYRQAFPDAAHLILDLDGRAAGRIIVAVGREGDRLFLHLVDIVIAEHARGQGLGTDVLTALIRAEQTRGLTQVRLSVLLTNNGARRLYERLGFLVAGDDGARLAMVRPLP
ncbi:MAG: GNAT family N-acetyltransferase [Pseudomonadota bacterium]